MVVSGVRKVDTIINMDSNSVRVAHRIRGENLRRSSRNGNSYHNDLYLNCINRENAFKHSRQFSKSLTDLAPEIMQAKEDSGPSLSQADADILARQEDAILTEKPTVYLTRVDSNGNVKPVKVEEKDINGSFSEIVTPNLFGRPLLSIINTKYRSWNPFHKPGILGVMKAQSKRNRVVSKHGHINTFCRPEEVQEQHRFLKDFFISMIDFSWSMTLMSFAASFYLSWLVFAVIWYLVALYHGDLDPHKGPDHQVCVSNLVDFTSCFLFSLETQHTIGYGVRVTTEVCPIAVLIMSIQSIFGVIIQACMAGVLFAKFTKPTMRAETFMFSKNALINLRNGNLYLTCRIGDLRQSHLLESHVSGHIVHKMTTEEGEEIPYHVERLEFGSELDGSEDYFQMFWPMVVSHKISESSPLYEMSPTDILKSQFEIIVTIEGTTPETGNTIQVRTSYLPNEILWGYRFDHCCVAYDKKMAKYAVSYTTMNNVIADRTPRCSAKELADRKVKRSSSTASMHSF